MDIYEVFTQKDPSSPHEHQFSLLAMSPRMALTLAQENFLRRRTAVSVWVVRRDHITKTGPDEQRCLERLPKPYRSTEDYKYLIAKWRKYRQVPMTPDNML